jgi:putative hemolysin
VVLNAVFAGSELALVSLREGQLRRLEEASRNGAVLASLARDPNRFLATIQIGITLAGFLASASAAVTLAEPLEEPLSFLGGAAGPAAIVVVTLVLSYATLVFGELAPKRIAMQRAERWGLVVARPLAWLASATRPVVWLLSRSTDIAVKVLGGDPSREREDVTEEEIRDMIATQVSYTPTQRAIIDGALEIGERRLQDVLCPRPDVVSIPHTATRTAARELLRATGHSRAPVVTGDIDQVIGMVHLRDLIDDDGPTVTEAAKPVPFFPESAGVLETLRDMQTRRAQLAVVVNEHGGGEGIVTIEDLVEELVGEIYDETDRDILGVVHAADGSMVLPGRFPFHDLDDVGIDAPDGDYSTVAGLVLDRLQRIPEAPGDTVEVGDWTLTVLEVSGRTIASVRARRLRDRHASPDDGPLET